MDAEVPLPEDRAFIGQRRRCAHCRNSRAMWWVPDADWQRYAPEKYLRRHLCFGCFVVLGVAQAEVAEVRLDNIVFKTPKCAVDANLGALSL